MIDSTYCPLLLRGTWTMRRTVLWISAVLLSTMSCVTGQPTHIVVDPHQVAQRTTLSACVSVDGKADKRCTPGVLNPAVTQATIAATICTPGWAERVRPPTTYTTPLKVYQMHLYGLYDGADPPPPELVEEYREDHLVALELGGATRAPLNLWPQPKGPAIAKNNHAARLKVEVCAGRMRLIDAQAELVTTWTQIPVLP